MWTEIDKVLNDTRDEAKRQLIAAGLPPDSWVQVALVRHSTDAPDTDCLCVSARVEKTHFSGRYCKEPVAAIASIMEKWGEAGKEIFERAEFEAWKAAKTAPAKTNV